MSSRSEDPCHSQPPAKGCPATAIGLVVLDFLSVLNVKPISLTSIFLTFDPTHLYSLSFAVFGGFSSIFFFLSHAVLVCFNVHVPCWISRIHSFPSSVPSPQYVPVYFHGCQFMAGDLRMYFYSPALTLLMLGSVFSVIFIFSISW